MRKTWWASGEWNALCDICGVKRKSSQLIQRWDGLMVCKTTVNPGCWETRHPQEYIRPMPDQQKLPWTRPESNDVFVSDNCTGVTINGVADVGTADCAKTYYDNGQRDYIFTPSTNTL